MANARGIEFHEKLSDVTECSICADIFSNPKILPCVHTFCLHCLEKYGKCKKSGEKMACPICRNEFVIPDGDLSKLPNNFFIDKIVEIGKLATIPAKGEVCQLCLEETTLAKKFCIDCEQKLCDRCITLHSRMKHCQSHDVVELGSQINYQKLNFRNSYCEHHPKELIKMYCYEDNVAICLICFAQSHQSHKCSDVDKAAGHFTEQLKYNLRKVANRRPECEGAFEKLEKFKTEFAEEVTKTEENIRKSGADLKKLIDQHTEALVQNLRVVRDRNLKCFETTKQDVARFKVMIDSYQRYCDELLTRGSPVDICRAANQMHTRAIELEKLPANCSVEDFNCDKIAFHFANVEMHAKQHQANNVVGELLVKKSSDRIVKFQKRSENDVPATWATMTYDEEFKTIQLKASDQEYKVVAKAFLSTAQNTVKQIVKIERIQNKRLYKQYVVRKTAMDAANPEIQNEMTLWHDTRADILDSITRTGFNQSNCVKRGSIGTGIYFAKNYRYAAEYIICCSPDESGLKHVFQCKVLTGEYVLGNYGIAMPPSKPGNTDFKYDSTVDDTDDPIMFVLYCSTQAYPEYLIHFK